MSLCTFLTEHKKTPDQRHTHTWFAAGVGSNRTVTLCIPNDEISHMHELLVRHVTAKAHETSVGPNSISEKFHKDVPFRFVVDLDFKPQQIEAWCAASGRTDGDLKKTLRDIALMCQDVVRSACEVGSPANLYKMVVATRLPYKLHLHFPNIIINSTIAKSLSKQFTEVFQTRFPELWSAEVVDDTIYRTGLRLLYCHKGSMMSVKKRAAECEAHEAILGKGSYRDEYYVTDIDSWILSDASITDLQMTSTQVGTDIPLTNLTIKGHLAKDKKCKGAQISSTQSESGPLKELPNVHPHELLRYLAEISQITQSDMNWTGRTAGNKGAVIPTRCKRCPFAGKEHNSNHLYLILTATIVTLKCHDEQCTATQTFQVDTFPEKIRKQLEQELGICSNDSSSITVDAEVTEEMRLTAVGSSLHAISEHHPRMDISHPTISRTRLGGGDNWICKLPRNMWCPIHQREHDSASNCILMTLREQQIMCQREPDLLMELPLMAQYGNIIFGNQYINNLNITLNGSNANEPELSIDGLFDQQFAIFADDKLNTLMLESFNGNSYNIAKLVHYLGREHLGLGDNNEKDVWWVWNTTTLRWEKNARRAGSYVSTVIAAKYIEAQHWFRENTEDAKLRALREAKIASIVRRLQDKDKRQILKDVAEVFDSMCEPSMDSKLDKDPFLLGFAGEIYNLQTGTRKLTESTDYVSMSVGYPLPGEIDHGIRNHLVTMLQQIQPVQEEFEYLLRFLASTLDGRNAEEIFAIWTGEGRNGKSLLQDLMQLVLGDYFKPIAATMLTNDRPDSSKPIPDVLHLRNKRFAAASEPEEKKQINAGFVKWLTGNDPISGCFKHENEEVKFRGQHSLILLCNKIPAINAEDKAFWRRARVQHFGQVFVDNPRPGTNERQVDMSLKSKIEAWAPQFMLLLLEFYQQYQELGLAPTRAVLEYTNTARNSNDPLIEFVDSHFQKSDNEQDRIKRKTVHDALENWCRSTGRRELLQKKQHLQHQLRIVMSTYGFTLDPDLDAKPKMKRILGEEGGHIAFSNIRVNDE